MAQKIAEIKPKIYYDVKIETMLPATITFKVLAEDPEQAILLTKHMAPSGVQHKLAGRKDKKVTVYNMGSSMVRLVKRLTGL